jgi:TonB-linked SusC/RagA family outer membrane protein
MRKLLILFVFLLIGGVQAAIAQKLLKGKVTSSEDGSGIPGASIVVAGTTVGTITNSDGNFSITAPANAKTLKVSFVGMKSQEVTIGSKTDFNIKLESEITALDEVVAVGYGTQKKSDLTGAISSVKGNDLTLSPVMRADQALQGRAAGVMVQNTDGAPGGNITIRVRGSNSLQGNSNALVVIDGLQGGDMKTLNPNDIESIEVLKDASATAIYGSRGANGVILISTKKGKSGKPVINYNFSEGAQRITKVIDVMNAGEFARAANEFSATLDEDYPPSGFKPFTDEEVANFEKNGGTDWQREVYKTGKLINHQLSISGGGEHMNYFVSGSYMDNKGIMINSYYKRYNLRANVNTDINEWVSIGLNWAGTKEISNVPPFGNGSGSGEVMGQAANEAYLWDATTPVYDSSGNYMVHKPGYGHDEGANPVLSAMETFNEINTVNNNISGYLEFKPLKGLSLKITGGAIIGNGNNIKYLNRKTFEGAGVGGLGTQYSSTSSRYQSSNILSYSREFKLKHRLVLTGVAEYQVENFQYYSYQGDGFATDVTGIYNLAGATNLYVTGNDITKRELNSYLGRANYTYDNKYAITASYRADGSSVLAPGNKWAYFPSLAVSWTASNESFFKKFEVLSNLKFRGGWGITGNQSISPYSTLASLGGATYPYDGGGSKNIGYILSSALNDNLKWESTEQGNAGVDLGFFGNRLTATVDVYKKKTTDMLLASQIPWYTGIGDSNVAPSKTKNVGSMENKGIEIFIGGDPIVGKFKWNTSVMFSANRSKILDLGKDNSGAEIRELVQRASQGGGYGFNNMVWLIKGERLGTLKGHVFEGIWSTSEEAEANKFGQMPGDPKYKDLNGDHKINASDLTIIAHTAPKFSFGFNNKFSYKDFELSFTIQGVYGNQIFNAGRIFTEKTNWGLLTGTSRRLLDHWTPTNQDTDIPGWIVQSERTKYRLEKNLGDYNVSVNGRDSRYVEDGSYIRLKTVNLGYNLPKSICNKVKMDRLRVYVAGSNLLTLTKYTGYDPEASSFSSSDGRAGIDNSNYPQSKTYTVGIDVTF